MKKTTNNLTLAVLFFLLALLPGSPSMGQEPEGKTKSNKEDPMKNFSIIEKVQPVPEDIKAGFESITGKDASAYLKFLASDLLEGRDTGKIGYDIAAEFAGTMFALWDIKPAGDFPQKTPGFRHFSSPEKDKKKNPQRGYFQEVEMKEIMNRDSRVTVGVVKGSESKSRTFYPDIDYQFQSSYTQTLSAPVVFVGYGICEKGKEIKYDDYKKIDVKGKIVMILSEVPGKDDPQSPFNTDKMKKKYFPQRRMMRHMTSPKIKLAKEKGAVGVILVENSPGKNPDVPKRVVASRKINDEKPIIPGKRRRLNLFQSSIPMPWATLPTIRVSRDMADVILGYAGHRVEKLKSKIEKNYKPHSSALPGVSIKIESTVEEKLIRSRNVLGYIEGSDPELKDEVIVIGAHLDHLGKRGDYIFNGADDNGSGSAAIMEIAQAFAMNPQRPKRSVLFALWTGEEKGLLGSRYYVSHPFFPLKKTVSYINLDMISREWTMPRLKMAAKRFGVKFDEKILESIDMSKFLSLSLSRSDELFNTLKENNRYVGLQLHFRITDRWMGGSDHASFGYHKIPWVSFFASMTEDFHQPSDSFEKISLNLIEKIGRLSWLTIYSLADK